MYGCTFWWWRGLLRPHGLGPIKILSHRHSIANRSCSNARGEVNLAGFTAVYLDDQGGASVDVESPQARVVCWLFGMLGTAWDVGVRYVWPKTVANGEQCIDLDDLDANVSQGQFDSLGDTKFIEIPHFAAGISMPVSHLHSRLSWCQRHCQIQSLEF